MPLISLRASSRAVRLCVMLLLLGAGAAAGAWRNVERTPSLEAPAMQLVATETAPAASPAEIEPAVRQQLPSPWVAIDPGNDTVEYPELYATVTFCTPDGFNSETVWGSGGASVYPDAYGTCVGKGGTNTPKAYFVQWTELGGNVMTEGDNTIWGYFCDNSFNCVDRYATYHYRYPIDGGTTLTALDPGASVRVGDSVAISFEVNNATGANRTYTIVQPTCEGGLAICANLDGNPYVPASGKDTVRIRVKGTWVGSGMVTLRICRMSGIVHHCSNSGFSQVAVLPALPSAAAARVTPNAATTNKGGSTTFSLTYRVKNLGAAATTFAFEPSCAASIVASGCTASPASASINPGDSTTVTVGTMTTTNPGSLVTAAVGLTARAGVAGVTGQTAVTVGPGGGAGLTPAVLVSSYALNPQGSVSRDQCLMLAAGDAAGVECGDLRLAHGIPGVKTLDTDRAPSLVYLSRHARPVQLIAANVTVLGGPPSSITTTLSITGEDPIQRTHRWPASCTNLTCRITVPVDAEALGLATGWHTYTLQAQATVGGTPYSHTDSGGLAVVNRTTSRFGRGWWVEGVEEVVHLASDSTRKLWVGGDGSTRLYKKPTLGSAYYLAVHSVGRPDTLHQNGYDDWRRRLPNGAYVRFNNTGQHIATVNGFGQTTTLKYAAGALDSIILPVPSGSGSRPAFKFNYKDTASTKILLSVTAPSRSGQPRTTTIERAGGWRIQRILDPGDTIGVLYGSNATTGLIDWRRTRLRDTTFFTYDSLAAVTITRRSMYRSGDTAIVTTMCPVETRGLVWCSWSGDTLGASPLPDAVTRVNGPRGGLIDVMTFHLNRFGSPDTVQTPSGARTRIERDATFPALPARITSPTGVVQRAWYNARGLADSMHTIGALGGADVARTRVKWNSQWAMPDTVMSTGSASTRNNYDSGVPKLHWSQVGGDSTRVRYYYNAAHRIDSVVAPGGTERFTYETTLGNVRTAKSGAALTTVTRDFFGLDSIVYAPESLVVERTFRSLLGRVDSTRATSKAVNYTMPISGLTGGSTVLTRVVRKTYDVENNLLSVQRADTLGAHEETAASTYWTYDPARRLRVKEDAGAIDSFWYDPAGNRTVHRTPRGLRINSGYDASSNMIYRVLPFISQASSYCGVCATIVLPGVSAPYFPIALPNGASTQDMFISGDMEQFIYDAAGRMRSARNSGSAVNRDYYPGGALRGDTAVTWYPGGTKTTTMQYEVDTAGRRTKRTESSDTYQRYLYEDSLGVLRQTIDRQSDSMVVNFTYDAAGRLKNRAVGPHPYTLNESRTYDVHGRLLTRVDQGAFTAYTVGTVSADYYSYDSSGRQVYRASASDQTALADTSRMWYDGFGALLAVERSRAYGGIGLSTDEYTSDALQNRRTSHANRWTIYGLAKTTYNYSGERLQYQDGLPLSTIRDGGEPAVKNLDSITTGYDASGNRSWMTNIRFYFKMINGLGQDEYDTTTAGTGATYNYYDAGEKLRYVQRIDNKDDGRVTVQEMTYDALGRRVSSRTLRDIGTCQGVVTTPMDCHRMQEVFVWDGDQMLREFRTSITPTSTNGNFYGTVQYTHAHGIDDPVLVRKDGGSWIVPHRTGRGHFEHGTVATNAAPVTAYHWPGRWASVDMAADARIEPAQALSWFGSLLEGQQDQSGLMYMRNRYYDPASGRFTQRDPIGLAGGLNQYGYVGGDPINFSDPFGLLQCPNGSSGIYPNCFNSAAGVGIAVTASLGGAASTIRRLFALQRSTQGGSDASTWHGKSGILREAGKQEGNGGGATATATETEQLGIAWVGEGATTHRGGTVMRSADKTRVYRRAEVKADGTVQANLERMGPEGDGVVGNYHINVVAPRSP